MEKSPGNSGPGRRPVTQGDIAKALDISRIAVSYALRGSTNVSVRTRERVAEMPEKLGYRVNSGARAMRTGSFSCLGLILSAEAASSALPHPLLSAILREVGAREKHLITMQVSDEEMILPGRLPVSIREHIMDGALVHYTHQAPSYVTAMLEQAGLGNVWLNTRRSANCVFYDEEASGRMGAEILLEQNCQRFLYVTRKHTRSQELEHYSVAGRRDGFVSAIRAAGRPVEDVVLGNDYEGSAMIADFVTARPGKAGIFAYSEAGAKTALVACLDRGIRMGEDFALAAVQGQQIRIASYRIPTVYLDYDGMAAASIEMLDHVLADPSQKMPPVAIAPLREESSALRRKREQTAGPACASASAA